MSRPVPQIPFLDLQRVNAAYEPMLSEAVARVVASGWYLNGAELARFEEEFAAFVGADFCVGVGNGLDALTLSLLALKHLRGWGDGDEVIVPAMTFVATAEAVVRAGLQPVLCDITPDFLMDPAATEQAVTPSTRAILPVHLYGKACDMQALRAVAERHGLALVEDAAQAHGAWESEGCRVGSGEVVAFSFYPGKNLGALGDGGAVVTRNADLAHHIRALANYGAEQKYEHRFHGMNSRLDEVQAAALRVKLPQLDADNARRQALAAIYSREIKHPDVRIPYNGDTGSSVFHIYPVLCKHRAALQQYLSDHGVQTLVHYPHPIHHQKSFAALCPGSYPMAEQTAAECLSLPLSPVQTADDTHTIATLINQFDYDA